MRLVDLHCDWLRQYATETTLYDASHYAEVPGRVGRLDGYLLGTSLSVLACDRKPEDWAGRSDPWGSVGLMIARYEAEFAGRILRDAADVAPWRSSPADGMCWGILGVAGFDFLVRESADLDRLPALFGRGVRVWQPVGSGGGVLGGSTTVGDDRGLTDLGRAFLDRLAGLAGAAGAGPRPILDLAGMNGRTVDDTMLWYDQAREKLPIGVTHGIGGDRGLLDGSSPEARILGEVRSRGGTVALTTGLAGSGTADDFKGLIEAVAALPFEGRPGYEGIAIASDLLGLEETAPGLSSAREIVRWLGRAFDPPTASAIAARNAESLLLRSVGAPPIAGSPTR